MNPYDFVRVDLNKPPRLSKYAPHDRLIAGALHGRFEGTLTLLMPTFVKQPGQRQVGRNAQQFMRSNKHAIIPGSSLKGLFRSVVETVGGCWWWLCNSRDLPPRLARPDRTASLDQLDVACRLFGFLAGSKSYLGNVSFGDAVCEQEVTHSPIYTPIHDSPKPRHSAWYAPDGQIAGRKFYLHHNGPIVTETELRETRDGSAYYNSYIAPLNTGSVFRFGGQFENIAPEDWALLLYAMTLEPDMRHKIGFAKAAGLGSIEVRLTALTVLDPAQRYTAAGVGGSLSRGLTTHSGDGLGEYVRQRVKPYAGDHSSNTLNDLRRIWAWPAQHTLRYPGRKWFDENPTTPLSQAP